MPYVGYVLPVGPGEEALFAVAVLPFAQDLPQAHVTRQQGTGLALQVDLAAYSDLHMLGPTETAEATADGEQAFLRRVRGVTQSLALVGGKSLEVGGTPVVNSTGTVSLQLEAQAEGVWRGNLQGHADAEVTITLGIPGPTTVLLEGREAAAECVPGGLRFAVPRGYRGRVELRPDR